MDVILTHEQADFDALGALLGAYLLSERSWAVLPRRLNRNVRAFISLYGSDLPFIDLRDLPSESIENLTLVDTQSMITLKGVTQNTHIHIVDHHQQKTRLPPDWSFSGDRLGSCTALFVEDLQQHNGDLNPIHATLLLLGIYEDTGSLTYVSTTPRDIRAAAYLMEQGASLRIAAEYLNPPLSPAQRILYERLESSVETLLIHGQHIVLACANADDLNEEISSVAHKLRDLLDPDAILIIVNTIEGIRLVARSTSDQVDVSAIAAKFGGGGHERAAAALIRPEIVPPEPENLNPMQRIYQQLAQLLPEYIRPAITIGQIMSLQPRLLSPETPAQEAAQLMQRYGYEGYPVVREGKVIGLLTRRTVDRALSHKLNLSAESLMDAGEVTVKPNDTLDHLQQVMSSTGWGQIPVIDAKGQVIGIVTRTDLLKTLAGSLIQSSGKLNFTKHLDAALPPARLILLREIASLAFQHKIAAYIVGGFVRDLLLERPSLDFDVVIEGDAIALGRLLAARFGGRLVSHRQFGTTKWWIADIRLQLCRSLDGGKDCLPTDLPDSLDLISARTEFYEYPTALPSVERSGIKLDLHRRDFTINTMALRLDGHHYGELYDYWGGLNDLRRRLVRVLHSLSFVDDPTRLLRAVRFEQRFNFQIEERTLQLMDEAKPLLRQVSGDRIRHELDLILAEGQPIAALARLNELKLLSAIHPDLIWQQEMVLPLQRVLLDPIDPAWDLPEQLGHQPIRRALAYLVWLLLLPADKAETTATHIRLAGNLRSLLPLAARLIQELPSLEDSSPSVIVEKLDAISPVALYSLAQLDLPGASRSLLIQYITKWRHIQPITNGDALRSLGILPGPAYRQILGGLRAGWLNGEIHSPMEEQIVLRKMVQQPHKLK